MAEETGMTTEEADNALADALVEARNETPEEAEPAEAEQEETEDNTEEPAEEVEEPKEDEQEEASEKDAGPAPADLDKILGLDPNQLKAELGRARSTQSKVDKSESRINELADQISRLTEALHPKTDETKLDGDGLINGLSADNGPEYLNSMIQKQVEQATRDLREKQAELDALSKAQAAQNEYVEELVELSGDDYGKFEPVYKDIMDRVSEAATAGDPGAQKMRARLSDNPEYMHMIAQKVLAGQIEAKAKAVEDKREEASKGAGSGGNGTPTAPGNKVSKTEADNALASFLAGGR